MYVVNAGVATNNIHVVACLNVHQCSCYFNNLNNQPTSQPVNRQSHHIIDFFYIVANQAFDFHQRPKEYEKKTYTPVSLSGQQASVAIHPSQSTDLNVKLIFNTIKYFSHCVLQILLLFLFSFFFCWHTNVNLTTQINLINLLENPLNLF